MACPKGVWIISGLTVYKWYCRMLIPSALSPMLIFKYMMETVLVVVQACWRKYLWEEELLQPQRQQKSSSYLSLQLFNSLAVCSCGQWCAQTLWRAGAKRKKRVHAARSRHWRGHLSAFFATEEGSLVCFASQGGHLCTHFGSQEGTLALVLAPKWAL